MARLEMRAPLPNKGNKRRLFYIYFRFKGVCNKYNLPAHGKMRHQYKVTVISAVFNLDAEHFHFNTAGIADTQR